MRDLESMKGSSQILDRTSGLLARFLCSEVEDEVERERNEEESRQPAQETDEDGTNAVEGQRRGDGSPLGCRRMALTSMLPSPAWPHGCGMAMEWWRSAMGAARRGDGQSTHDNGEEQAAS